MLFLLHKLVVPIGKNGSVIIAAIYITLYECSVPTKHLCILMLAPLFLHLVPYLHQFSTVQNHHHNPNFFAGTAPFDGAIWDEFNEQQQYYSTKNVVQT